MPTDPAFDFRHHVVVPLSLFERLARCYWGDGPRAYTPDDDELGSLVAPNLSTPVDTVLEELDLMAERASVGGVKPAGETDPNEEPTITPTFDLPGFKARGIDARPRKGSSK